MSTQTIPAVEKSVVVAAPVYRAFEVFTEQVATWWPLHKHGIFQEAAESLALETSVGGRFVERSKTGEESVWGEVLECDPPHRIAFTWHPGFEEGTPPTEIVVTFAADGEGTRVTLVHTGWERLGERGAGSREGYDSGWVGVLEQYREAAS
jgi:uncharacterized protein YndB with AHSA1/START domain